MNKSFEKIIINGNDELVDVLRKLKNSTADYIVLTFAEDTDLLVSPITFKVILKESDDLDKVIVAQIIQNNSGIANARQADVITTDLPTQVGADLWEIAETEMRKRKKEIQERLKTRLGKSNEQSTISEVTEEALPQAEVQIDMSTQPPTLEADLSTTHAVPVEEAQELKSSFEERISKALEKSRNEINKDKLVQDGSFVMAIDKDIEEINSNNKTNISTEQNLNQNRLQQSAYAHIKPIIPAYSEVKPEVSSNLDLSNIKTEDFTSEESEDSNIGIPKTIKNITPQTLKPENQTPIEKLKNKILDFFAPKKDGEDVKAEKISNDKPKSLKEKLLINGGKLLLVTLLLAGVIGYFMYELMPLARVKIYIESKPISIEKVYIGNPGSEYNEDLATVASKTEEIKKERSDSAKATGVDYKGTRAIGAATIKCFYADRPNVNLPAGSVFSFNGLNFVTNNEVTVSCPGIQSGVGITAAAVGEEYNQVLEGSALVSDSHESSKLIGEVTTTTTGGAKTPIKVVSAKDIEDLTNKLKEVTFAEATTQLKELKKREGWQVIESTIKNEIDEPEGATGDQKGIITDVPAGTEAEAVNITIKTKSTAQYFNKTDIEKTVNSQLSAAAKTQNLFEGIEQTGSINELKDVKFNVELVSIEDKKVTVKLTASGMAKPDVNINDLSDVLRGKGWEEGKDYLATLKFVTKPSEVQFIPDWFPEFAWHFPKSQGRIVITVEEVQKEKSVENNNSTSNTEAN